MTVMTQDKVKVQSRLWRHGELEAENFPFEKSSDYLEQDGCLVWVDICDPDSQQLRDLFSLEPRCQGEWGSQK